MGLEPGETIHYVGLLDREANVLHVLPLNSPLTVPPNAEPETISVDVRLHTTMVEKTS